LEGFSKEAGDFRSKQELNFCFFQDAAKNCKTLSANSEITDLIFRTFKNISSLHNLLGVQKLKTFTFCLAKEFYTQ
jgi:hypothetical protein